MKAYKGFNPDMTCRGFQYKEGETYETDEARLCSSGFHACECPIDILGYYHPSKSIYHEVELNEVSNERQAEDSKIVGKKIKIGAKLSINDLVSAQIIYAKDHYLLTTVSDRNIATAYKRSVVNTGDSGIASAYDSSVATADECGMATVYDYGVATTGDRGIASVHDFSIATSEDCGMATARSFGAAISGYCGISTAYNFSVATAGDYGIATSRGNSSVGIHGIAVARGNGCKVRGGLYSVLVIIEENPFDESIYDHITAVVDGEIVKADTWYYLKDHKLVECQDED